MINCLLIDDDKVSRVLLEKYISKSGFFNLIATFDNAIDASMYLQNEKKIDLIFLDIEMPEMSGVEFLKNVENLPMIIVISAKEKYAIEAIEFNVIDYLLKPVPFARFLKAANKAMSKHKEIPKTQEDRDGIFIKSGNSSFVYLKYTDIFWIEAMENYVVVNTFDEKYTIHFTMKSITEKIPVNKFIRIHRSYIVNISNISSIEDNDVVVKIKSGAKKIPIAKSYKEQLMNSINIVTK